MTWVLFEVFLALGLAVFIVWWTFPKSKKPSVLPNASAQTPPTTPPPQEEPK